MLVLRPWEGELEEGPGSVTTVVARVVDGDTVEAVVDGELEDVRLIGVDTPETVKPGEPVQCFGPQASRFTKQRLEGERVRLVFGAERRDLYGRLLAYVYLPRPTLRSSRQPQSRMRLFNADLVRRGFARTLTIPPNDRFAPRLRQIELAAARAGRGLWDACGP
ncbi:MAG TPA: thermonuclease family protein [Solirubrobacterales bacterium]|nr:thermonuclease family protein [Solirubrobacterales bacterium]